MHHFWSSRCAKFRVRLAPEHGFTLVELLVATVLALIICGASMTTLENSQRRARADEIRADALQGARHGMGKVTRELRQARVATLVSPQRVDAEVLDSNGVTVHNVTYECQEHNEPAGTYRCLRTEDGGAPRELVNSLTSDQVFSTPGGGSFIAINMVRKTEQNKLPVVLRGGVKPRGCDEGTGLLGYTCD